MATVITVTWWRDIPSGVTAGRGRTAVRVNLPDRFQQAIDRAAARAGLVAEDAYLAEWRRLGRLVAAGGLEEPSAAHQPEPGA